jgi:hypothetical protein
MARSITFQSMFATWCFAIETSWRKGLPLSMRYADALADRRHLRR